MAARYPPTLGITGFDGGTKPAIALATRRSLVDTEGESQPSPPGTGACCADDGSCTITTEADCTGTYQGDNTTCDPNPCETPTGACCVDSDCSITTEDDCTGMGGTYQGDDTVCDPNPCLPPCCPGAFDAFDGSGRKFLTKTEVSFQRRRDYTIEACVCSGTGNPVGEIIWEYQFTTVTSIDPDTCIETTDPCTGYSFKTDESCVPFGPCSVSDCSLCFPSGFLVFMAITDTTDTTATTSHTHGAQTFPGSDCTVFQIDRADDFLTTLSDECMPDGFSPPP